MNNKLLTFCLGLLFCVAGFSIAEEVVIPTEVSEPPYEVGQLPREQGYYIKRGDGQTQINFRIVNNQMRVYWIDENGLIAEPEATSGNVRFMSTVRGRGFYGLSAISGDAGIGAPGIIPTPHIFNLILTLESGGETTTHSLRYTGDMDVARLPEGATAPAGGEAGN